MRRPLTKGNNRRVLRLRLVLALAVSAALVSLGGPTRLSAASQLSVPQGFTLEKIATVSGARELAVAPNGDLFVATSGNAVDLIADAQGQPQPPKVFVRIDDAPVAGVTLDGDRMIVGGQFGVYELPYHRGERSASAQSRKIASVRTSGQSGSHVTTSVAVSKGTLYASVGSSCNACSPEVDPTRATVQALPAGGGTMTKRATDIRNAIALTTNSETGAIWAGVAGRDDLQHGHPYEIFDPITAHAGTPDYGWLRCYDGRHPIGNASCDGVVVPRVVFPAYDTPVGATFYPLHPAGAHAFPAEYRGGAFVTLHGSWHTPPVPPRIAFVAMNGDDPKTSVDWNDPTKQWREFVSGFQTSDGSRVARPTGVAVGTDGTLFFSEDSEGGVYRVRPRG